jgi:hypothetical protein
MGLRPMRAYALGILAILLVALSACGPSATSPAPTAEPTAVLSATSPPSGSPSSVPAPTTVPTAAPTQDASVAAVQALLDYYDLLTQQHYDQAYHVWAQDGAASGQTAEAFAQGFAGTAGISVLLDRASRDGDQVTVPITIFSVENQPDQSQQAQRFSGTYTLTQAADGWKIAGANIAASAAPLPSDIADGPSVVQAYYQAINAQNEPWAYTLWDQNGAASQQRYLAFAQGFAQTARVDLHAGQATTGAAAGSLYAQVPVVIFADQRDGSTQAYCGIYTVRRANVPPFDQFGWRITRAEVLPVPDLAPGSDRVPQLLGGQCPAR